MKNVNPFEMVVVKIVDEFESAWFENVWLTDVPKIVRSLVKTSDETPLVSIEVLFNADPVKNRDGLIEIWSGYPR